MDSESIGDDNKNDPYYRYQMPKMVTKIEGRGNGIKTNVVNMVEIAKELARPPSYTTKYFGIELGAQSKFDKKTGTAHVNGAHDTARLAGILENFIQKYVKCYKCGIPETYIDYTKRQKVTLNCVACGHVSYVDTRDKLSTFILKNPPEQDKSSQVKKAMTRAEMERLKEGEAADEEQKMHKKKAAGRKKGSTSLKNVAAKGTLSRRRSHPSEEDHSPVHGQEAAAEDDDDSDVEWQTDTSLEAAKQRIQEQLSAVTADMVMLSHRTEPKI